MKNYVIKWHGQYLTTLATGGAETRYGYKQKDAVRFTKEEAKEQAEKERLFYIFPTARHLKGVKLKNINFEKARKAFKEIGQIVKDGAVEALKEEIEQLKGSDARAQHFKARVEAQRQEIERLDKRAKQDAALLKLALDERDCLRDFISIISGQCGAAGAGVERLRSAYAEKQRKEEADKSEGRASVASRAGLGSEPRCPAERPNCAGKGSYKNSFGTVCCACGFHVRT